jgi:hypothetical protein
MKGGLQGRLAAVLVVLVLHVPAASGSPRVTLGRATIAVDGTRVATVPVLRPLRITVPYRLHGVPARWRASISLTLAFRNGNDLMTVETVRAPGAVSGRYRWVVSGPKVRLPATFPSGPATLVVTAHLYRPSHTGSTQLLHARRSRPIDVA